MTQRRRCAPGSRIPPRSRRSSFRRELRPLRAVACRETRGPAAGPDTLALDAAPPARHPHGALTPRRGLARAEPDAREAVETAEQEATEVRREGAGAVHLREHQRAVLVR